MPANYLLGMNCKLYHASAVSATPTGAESWTEIDNAKDVTLNLSKDEADITTRGNDGWKATVGTLKDGSIDFEMLWKPGDAAFDAIESAWANNTELAFAAMSGAIDAAGSKGLAGNFNVINFSRSEPLGEAVTVSVTIKPSSYTTWLTIAS